LRPLQQNDWQHAELRYLARLLSGPLHWWGFCDIVRAEDGRMLAFRLTSTAGLLPGKEFPVQAGTKTGDDHDLAGVLTVVDGETVLIDCTIAAWPAIALLEHFAEVAGVDSGRLRYRLSSAALGKAMSRGQDPTSLLQFLHSVQLQRPAEPLARMLEQLERRIASYGRVRIYTGASLLETADEMVMSELSATTRMDGQVARKLSPTLLILQRPGSEQLFDELKRRGQAPLLHEEDVYGAE
ncbi:MAG: helicase-associated domain-containing protein, partial [Ktedonobacteraceae bacterium]|nr:helicase-associated domain-containing protein [Ktedonobacteraceae bacterium]